MKFALVAVALATGAAAKPGPLAIVLNSLPPRSGFASQTPPPAPNYADPASWATRPGRNDAAHAGPRGVATIDEARAPADVFFVYPTIFIGGQRWNADTRDAALNAKIEATTMREQASVFSGCCRLYAPRYRQMVLGGYLRVSASSRAATDLAYADVRRAFDHYLANDNQGRPFIIAGHSQGSRLARRLIEERIDGRPVARRMVAAYLPGHWIERGWFARLKSTRVCATATETGCVLTWSSWEEGRDAARSRRTLGRNTGDRAEATGRDYACTNPLTWRTSAEAAPASANLGGWVHGPGSRPNAPVPGLAGARCDDGALYITPVADRAFTTQMLPNGNFHNYDFNLVYMNVRANARARITAWRP